MNQDIWDTLDNLFKTMHRQARRVEELQDRVTELERLQYERSVAMASRPMSAPAAASELHIERAA
ncbi:MAG: hypothetical protein WKF30_07940 [Pyrinomonadaceae bacterium]